MRQETAKIPRDENSGLKPCSQQAGASPELLEIRKPPVHRQTGQQGAAWRRVLSQGNIFQAASPDEQQQRLLLLLPLQGAGCKAGFCPASF